MNGRGRGLLSRAGVTRVRPGVAVATALLVVAASSSTEAAPKPKRPSAEYDLDILGFNDGAPYRLPDVQAEAVLADPAAVVFRFRSANWMARDQEGAWVKVSDVVSRFPGRAPSELVQVFSVDFERDGVPELLLVVDGDELNDGQRYAPTILSVRPEGYAAAWSSTKLPGERYRVVDIRDLNNDGSPEVLLTGISGNRGFYQFHELVARSGGAFESLSVKHVNSIHYVDLDRDGRIEIVVRERVGRRGPVEQWTYVDGLRQWDGARFVDAGPSFPRYHDEQTLPTLVSELVDHYDAKLPILIEKVETIAKLRAEVVARTKKPANFRRRLLPALAALRKDQHEIARKRLDELLDVYPYDEQVLIGLCEIHAAADRWEQVLDLSIRALTVNPRLREAWWWLGVAFVQLEERSSAIASFHNAVRLCGEPEAGIAFLKARRGGPGMDASLQRAIDQALSELGGR